MTDSVSGGRHLGADPSVGVRSDRRVVGMHVMWSVVREGSAVCWDVMGVWPWGESNTC